MADASGSRLLECSRRGDTLSVAYKLKHRGREPVAECIERLGRGRSLRVKTAFEMNKKTGLRE